ncbi:hypothetical protein ACE3MS_30410 [Paenibacillus dendritiformis]|uniref:hypothetical protein n=1 Tax=Paenibacillus dendritiformis TaxID=130049 RepID=UPI003659801D
MRTTNSFITFIGLSYCILGLLRAFGVTKIEFKFLFSLSLAGFWFILFDFIILLLERKTNDDQPKPQKLIHILKNVTLLLCALSIVVIPFIPVKWNNYFLKQLNDGLVFCGLGLVIVLIGLKSVFELKKFEIDQKGKKDSPK